MIKDKIKNYYPLIVFILFLFIDAFGLDPDHFDSIFNYQKIVVPYIPMNITIACFIISLFGIVIMLINKHFNLDCLSVLLFIRIILYFITSLFHFDGEYKIGICYAMVQCLFAYIISKNYKKDYKYIYIALLIFTLLIAVEIFYIPLKNHVNFFPTQDSPSKWYMILPMGKHNYITCILLPSYLFLSNTFLKDKKYNLIYTIIIGLAILVTSSRWGFVLFIIFTIINNIDKIKQIITKKRNVIIISIVIVALITIFWKVIVGILSRYSINIFTSRIEIYKESISLFLKHPLLGRAAYSFTVFDSNATHNFILESLVQTGIIGTIIYFACLYLIIKQIISIKDVNIRKGFLLFVVAFLVQGLAEPNLFGLRSDFFFWIIVGFGISIANQKETFNNDSQH